MARDGREHADEQSSSSSSTSSSSRNRSIGSIPEKDDSTSIGEWR